MGIWRVCVQGLCLGGGGEAATVLRTTAMITSPSRNVRRMYRPFSLFLGIFTFSNSKISGRCFIRFLIFHGGFWGELIRFNTGVVRQMHVECLARSGCRARFRDRDTEELTLPLRLQSPGEANRVCPLCSKASIFQVGEAQRGWEDASRAEERTPAKGRSFAAFCAEV